MNTKKIYSIPLMLIQLVLIVGLNIGINSCVGTTDFLTSALIPASKGHVKLSTDNKEHYVVQIFLKHLNPIGTSSGQCYVVWMVEKDGMTRNIGCLERSTNLFSGTIKTTFKSDSPIRPMKIYITLEDNPGIQMANTDIVFSTSTFQD